MNGLSKWTYERKNQTERGEINYVESKPILCDCGGSSPIGGDGARSASFFYDNFEWVCFSCGKILNSNDQKVYIG